MAEELGATQPEIVVTEDKTPAQPAPSATASIPEKSEKAEKTEKSGVLKLVDSKFRPRVGSVSSGPGKGSQGQLTGRKLASGTAGSVAGSKDKRAKDPDDKGESDTDESVGKNTALRIGIQILKMQKKKKEDDWNSNRPQFKYEPSYRLKPAPENRFSSIRVREVVTSVIRKYAEQEGDYNAKSARRLAVGIAEIAKNKIKELAIPRYKIVAEAFVLEYTMGESELAISSRAVGDPENDMPVFAEVKIPKKKLYIGVLIYGVYTE